MVENAEAYFNCLATGGYQPLLHRVSGTICFKISQEHEDQQAWHVAINRGEVKVRPCANDFTDADCIIAGPEDELLEIFNGDQSFAAAFVRGTITVQGDHTLAQNLRRFSPPAQVTEESRSKPHGGSDDRSTRSHATQRAHHRQRASPSGLDG